MHTNEATLISLTPQTRARNLTFIFGAFGEGSPFIGGTVGGIGGTTREILVSLWPAPSVGSEGNCVPGAGGEECPIITDGGMDPLKTAGEVKTATVGEESRAPEWTDFLVETCAHAAGGEVCGASVDCAELSVPVDSEGRAASVGG